MAWGPAKAWPQTTVFLKPADAIKLIFKGSEEVYKEDRSLTGEHQETARKQLGYIPPKPVYSFYVGKTGGRVDGYSLIDEQVGKVMPITFITRINPEGKVEAIEIMVYRESRGGEVKSKRFLKQFKNIALQDELRLHGNIVNITGATLSSHALVIGVRRALVLWNLFYGKQPSPQPVPGI